MINEKQPVSPRSINVSNGLQINDAGESLLFAPARNQIDKSSIDNHGTSQKDQGSSEREKSHREKAYCIILPYSNFGSKQRIPQNFISIKSRKREGGTIDEFSTPLKTSSRPPSNCEIIEDGSSKGQSSRSGLAESKFAQSDKTQNNSQLSIREKESREKTLKHQKQWYTPRFFSQNRSSIDNYEAYNEKEKEVESKKQDKEQITFQPYRVDRFFDEIMKHEISGIPGPFSSKGNLAIYQEGRLDISEDLNLEPDISEFQPNSESGQKITSEIVSGFDQVLTQIDLFSERNEYEKADRGYETLTNVRIAELKELFLQWGDSLLKQTKYLEAEEKYERAIIFDPNYKEAYCNWGNALAYQQKYEEATEKYEKATRIDPNYKETYFYWGMVLELLKRYQEAAEKFEKVISLDPNHKKAYCHWAITLYNQEEYQKAIAKLEKAVKIDPFDMSPYIILEEWGHSRNAFEIFQNNANLIGDWDSPHFKEAYLNWGAMLFKQGKSQEPAEKYEKAAVIDANFQETDINKGMTVLKLGKNREAAGRYEKSIHIDCYDF